MKHTPGPWKADYAGGYGRRGVFGPNGLIITTWAETDEHINEAEANAHLIAAAPELLEALKAIQAGFRDGSIKWAKKRQADSDPYHPANTLMCKAIARAEGCQ